MRFKRSYTILSVALLVCAAAVAEPVKKVPCANEGHGFHNEENQFEFDEAMEKFLAKHLAAKAR